MFLGILFLIYTLGMKMVAMAVVLELHADTWSLCLRLKKNDWKYQAFKFYLVGPIKSLISMNEA